MYLPVAAPQTESQLAVMVSMLDAYEIKHFVLNRRFGGLYPGMPMHLFNGQKIMVHHMQASDAFELLSVFQAPNDDFEQYRKMRWQDKVRVVIELFVGGWCVPVRRDPLSTMDDSPATPAPESTN